MNPPLMFWHPPQWGVPYGPDKERVENFVESCALEVLRLAATYGMKQVSAQIAPDGSASCEWETPEGNFTEFWHSEPVTIFNDDNPPAKIDIESLPDGLHHFPNPERTVMPFVLKNVPRVAVRWMSRAHTPEHTWENNRLHMPILPALVAS
jgi:hypothetical protein